jgi:flagellar biosynthesis regulator FlbT
MADKEWSAEECRRLYFLYFSALVINEECGAEEAAAFTRRQIKGLLSVNKLSTADILAIEAQVYRAHAWAQQLMNEAIRETPDTSISTTRH